MALICMCSEWPDLVEAVGTDLATHCDTGIDSVTELVACSFDDITCDSVGVSSQMQNAHAWRAAAFGECGSMVV